MSHCFYLKLFCLMFDPPCWARLRIRFINFRCSVGHQFVAGLLLGLKIDSWLAIKVPGPSSGHQQPMLVPFFQRFFLYTSLVDSLGAHVRAATVVAVSG